MMEARNYLILEPSDGITDLTAEFKRAQALGIHAIYCKPGIYHLSAPIIDNGMVLKALEHE